MYKFNSASFLGVNVRKEAAGHHDSYPGLEFLSVLLGLLERSVGGLQIDLGFDEHLVSGDELLGGIQYKAAGESSERSPNGNVVFN